MDKKIMPKKQSGCLPALKPSRIIDADTGEILDDVIIIAFLDVVLEQARLFSEENKDKILELLENPNNRVAAPVGTAWRGGLAYDYSKLSSSYKQRSRIGRIITHRVMTDWTSFFENPRKNKQEPIFKTRKATLGAADKQMLQVVYDIPQKKIVLTWACLTRNIILEFEIPDYFVAYKVIRMSFPTVHEKDGRVIFDFPFDEALTYLLCDPTRHMICAGYDLGRVKPYVLTIVNRFGKRIAVYEASTRLCELNRRREAKITKKKNLYAKRAVHVSLGVDDLAVIDRELDVLTGEISGLGDEIAVMTGHEIADYCKFHGVLCCFGEDLSRVNDWAGCSSRWVHGKQQEWIVRLCRRVGCAHMFVNAAGTSQLCAKCGGEVKHDSSRRLAICLETGCGFSEDRDRMASWVIAQRGLKTFCKYRAKVISDFMV